MYTHTTSRRPFSFARAIARAAALVLFAGSAVAIPSAPTALAAQGQSGTGITATKTAVGYNERRITYDWTVANDTPITDLGALGDGDCATVNYTLTATRTVVSDVTVTGVRGTIFVTNDGAVATEGLTIVDQIQFKSGGGPFADLAGASITMTPGTQLAPGETRAFPYDIQFTQVAGAQYRNTADVTITNHSGHIGTPFGPEARAEFTIPATPTVVRQDATATLALVETCPAGFTCTLNPATTSWNLTDNQTVQYAVVICNTSAACDTAFSLTTTATLTETTTGEVRTDTATVAVSSEPCDGGGGETGCTRTQGYYKNHPDALPDTMLLGSVTYTREQLVQILRRPVRGNGLISLEHQLIAAQANIASGASAPQEVLDAIEEANALIAGAQAANPNNPYLSPSAVGELVDILSDYNEGVTGPGRCD